ncbi:phage tail tape measure protein, TP901 family, core region [Alteribacillus persepolensis]|uniref:Phage tail tape measure protein, TP901 family, core region n=1 Tax=Alteribacillus persepolensis TaxID=568899 RepID=A0A1G8IKJ3_9BACI|nr:phage tail tape measure protein [Alteribacillus persepolensis]SDI19362.1 phage tail tape measure protein, TP901 family, core region [Alteribacillus persepolensis]
MAEEVGALKIDLSIDSADFSRSMTDINRKLRGLNSEFKANTAGNRNYERSLEGLQTRSKYLNDTLQLQRKRVQQLKRQYDQSVETKGRDAKETENLAIRYNRAVTSMRSTESQLDRVNERIEEQTNSWRQLGDQMQKSGQRLQAVGANLQGIGRSLSMYVTAPLTGAGAAALKVGMDFEEGMSQVEAVSGATGEEIQALEEQARELGSTTRFSATEAAEGMQYLSMAGFDVNETMEAMPGMLDLATAGAMELGQAADITSNIMSSFSMEADQAGRVSDVLAEAASSANTDVNQLGQAMTDLAPAANSMGWEVEDATAAVMALSDAGIQGSKAGATFSTSLTRLASPTGKAADLIEELGIELFDAEGQMKDMPAVVAEFEEAMEDMDDKTQAATLSTIVGQEAYRSWSVLLNEGSDALAANTEQLQGAEGAASEMADTMNDNAKGALRELRSNLEETGIILSETLLPVARDMTETLKDWSQAFQDLNPETQEFIVKAGGVAAATGPALMAIGGMANGVGALTNLFGRLLPRMGGKAGLVGAARLIPGPVGIAATAVTGLGTAAWGVNQALKENKEVNLEAVETMSNEIDTLDHQIERWESLKSANDLTNDEMVRFMEIQKEMNAVTDPQALEKLKEEQDQLQAKSSLSNEQLQEFIEVNNEIVEKTPGATGELTKYGDMLLRNADAAREENAALREGRRLRLQTEFDKAQENLNEDLERQQQLMDEINQAREREGELQQEILDAEENMKQAKEELAEAEGRELEMAERNLHKAERKYEELLEEQKVIDENLIKKQEELATTMEELGALDEVINRLIEIELEQANINAKRGEGVEAINEEIRNLELTKKVKEENASEAEKNTQKYKDGIAAIEGQISELENVRSNIIDLQGESDKLNEALGADISKTITVTQKIERQGYIDPTDSLNAALGNIPSYASGTDFHPGGAAIVGEEGPELVNLPRGSQVFTKDETENLLRNTPRDFAAIGRGVTQGLASGLQSGIASTTASIADVMEETEETARQYDGTKVGKDFVDSIVQGIEEAEDMANVNITSLLSSARNRVWEESPARSNIQRIRDVRESNIRLLEQEIDLLTQEGASQEDLNKAKEKQNELDQLREQKMQEYQNRIRDEQAILQELEKAYEDGNIIQSHYNQAVAEITTNINDLKMEANDLNRIIGEEQAEAIRESERAMEEQQQKLKEYAQEAAEAFRTISNDQMNAYDTAMEQQLADLQEKTANAIATFNEETNAYLEDLQRQEEAALETFDKQTEAQERAINRQIENIERRRDKEVQAIQDQLDAMDEEEKRRSRDDQRAEWGDERAALNRRLEIANFMDDPNTVREVEQEIQELEGQIADQEREWRRSDKRDALKEEQDRIKEQAELRIEEREEELTDYQERRANERDHLQQKFEQRAEAYEAEREQQLAALEQQYEDEEEAFVREYERQQERFAALSEQLAQHVADGKMTQEQANAAWLQAVEDLGNKEVEKQIENQEKTKEALNEYVDEYVNIGKSFGDGLINGLVGTLNDRLSDVKSAVSSVTSSLSSGSSSGGGGSSAPRGGGRTIGPDGELSDPVGSSSDSDSYSDNLDSVRERLQERQKEARANRYHEGGWVGRAMPALKADEVPAILQAGEYVLSRDMVSAIQRVGNIMNNVSSVNTARQPIIIQLDGEQIAGYTWDHATGQLKQEFRKG